MPHEPLGFLVYSLEELQEHLKEELARNPFLNVSDGAGEESDGDDTPPPKDDPEAAN